METLNLIIMILFSIAVVIVFLLLQFQYLYKVNSFLNKIIALIIAALPFEMLVRKLPITIKEQAFISLFLNIIFAVSMILNTILYFIEQKRNSGLPFKRKYFQTVNRGKIVTVSIILLVINIVTALPNNDDSLYSNSYIATLLLVLLLSMVIMVDTIRKGMNLQESKVVLINNKGIETIDVSQKFYYNLNKITPSTVDKYKSRSRVIIEDDNKNTMLYVYQVNDETVLSNDENKDLKLQKILLDQIGSIYELKKVKDDYQIF